MRSKTPINEIEMMVFFYNEGRMHWINYTIFQDLKIIEEFISMAPSNDSERLLKGLYRWLFIECKIIGIDLDSSKWRLYPTRHSTPRQPNGYDWGLYSIIFAMHIGFRLNTHNINTRQITRARCQM
jgi:Ulp1 family protease